MSKLSSILNYKPFGKQTSILPVTFDITVPDTEAKQFTLPKFMQISHNSNFVLKQDIVVNIEGRSKVLVDGALFQGTVHQSRVYEAIGDEFERFTLVDNYIGQSANFISDNFFTVFVDESTDASGDWHEYSESALLFLNQSSERVYERRFNEDENYDFKFGNGQNGMRLQKGNRVVIYYLVSDGENAVVDNSGIVGGKTPTIYGSKLYDEILAATYKTTDVDVNGSLYLGNILVSNTGPSTDIVYPESVESIRTNAPKAFASQNRLFTLGDYHSFITKNFANYCKDLYCMKNEQYTGEFLRYYYDLGLDRPQGDSRLNIAQVSFMTACNFNNIYAVVLPRVNTVVSWKVPNYLNNSLKSEITEKVEPYRGATHNLVILDPIYRAFTWGSPYLADGDFNTDQLDNTLVLVRSRSSKFSQQYIKEKVIDEIVDYFDGLKMGDAVDVAELSTRILSINGIKSFRIDDVEGNQVPRLTFYAWNPLYGSDDNEVTQQTTPTSPFTYCYFYDRDNLNNRIQVIDEH